MFTLDGQKNYKISNKYKKRSFKCINGNENFYSKISVIKPDLSHPDIIKCFNLSAKDSNLKQKK